MVSSTTASSRNSGGAQPGNPPHWALLLLLAGLLLLSRSQEERQQTLQVFFVLFQYFEALYYLKAIWLQKLNYDFGDIETTNLCREGFLLLPFND
jgi:MYXO-CTERM domain-containing protein